MIKRIKWYIKRYKVLRHVVKNNYNYGLCLAIDKTLGREESKLFKYWLTDEGYESSAYVYPTWKKYYGKRKKLLNQYVEYRMAE